MADDEVKRRDIIYIAAIGMGAVGGGLAMWPFVHQMNPSKDVLALSTIEVDISALEVGQAIKPKWRGKPVFIRRRTMEEIEAARAVDMSKLPDPQKDQDRVKEGKDEWLVLIGVCTHFGCVPLGQRGDFGGWFCPCHHPSAMWYPRKNIIPGVSFTTFGKHAGRDGVRPVDCK